MTTYLNLPGGAGGQLELPSGQGPHPAVVLLPAIAGVNDYVRRQAARFVAEGYACFTLDYYARQDGKAPALDSRERITAAVEALPDPQVLDDLAEVVAHLRGEPDVRADRIGLVGFCIGGTYALMAAERVPDLACSTGFYGMLRYTTLSANKPVSPLDRVEKMTVPFLGHFGEADALVPVADVHELSARTAGLPAEIYTYPGAGHAFHEDFRPQVYRPAAAAAAWERTGHHLAYHLRGVAR